jgi:hypothetical protein
VREAPTVNSNAGSLMEVLYQAAEQANATLHTPVRVRLGPLGTEHEIMHVRAAVDQRGLMLIIEADVTPVL